MHTPIHFVAPFFEQAHIGRIHPNRICTSHEGASNNCCITSFEKILLGNPRCYNVGEGYLICGSFSIVVYSNRCLGHNEHSDGSKHNHRECL